MNINLEKLSYAELVELRARIEAETVIRRTEDIAKIREEMTKKAQEHGFSLRDIIQGTPAAGPTKGNKIAVKYRDPKNPANTWTGRGRMPSWLNEATKGKRAKAEEFRIDKAA